MSRGAADHHAARRQRRGRDGRRTSGTLGPLGGFEARFDVINLLNNNHELRDGTGLGVFAKQFGPPRGFFGGLKKVL